MLKALGKWLVVAALVAATGGHWALLQTIAWVGMTLEFSQKHSLTVAIQKTFDGKNPCKLCKVVAKGQHEEKKQALEKAETKLDFFLTASHFAPTLVQMSWLPGWGDSSAAIRTETPPFPPPRLV